MRCGEHDCLSRCKRRKTGEPEDGYAGSRRHPQTGLRAERSCTNSERPVRTDYRAYRSRSCRHVLFDLRTRSAADGGKTCSIRRRKFSLPSAALSRLACVSFSASPKANNAICTPRSPIAWKPIWNPSARRSVVIWLSSDCSNWGRPVFWGSSA